VQPGNPDNPDNPGNHANPGAGCDLTRALWRA
jgi:hypothetical protein